MLITRHSVTTSATPERIWEFWRDVETWHTWDKGLDSASIEGAFATGTKGWLKPANGPKVKLELLDVRENEFFHDKTSLPFGGLNFFHTLEREGEHTKITQQIEMSGPLTFLFARLVGNGLRENLPSVMDTLVQRAESV